MIFSRKRVSGKVRACIVHHSAIHPSGQKHAVQSDSAAAAVDVKAVRMEVEAMSGNELGGAAAGARLPVSLPAAMSVEALLAVLGASDGVQPIDESRIRAPDEALILHVYSMLLSIPALRDTIGLHEKERHERERVSVDMEMQLHEAERLKEEAEKRAEENRQAKEEALRERLELAGSLAQVQGTLSALQSTVDGGVQQAADVKGRLDQTEKEKRGLLDMLEREKVENTRRAEEIETLTNRARESRSEINRLSTELQESKYAEGSAKFKIQSLEQELTLKSNDAKWSHDALAKATDDLAQHRLRSNGEISSLTLQLQQQTHALEASESKSEALKTAFEDTRSRLDEATREKAELRQRLVEQEGSFKTEMGTQQRLTSLMEQQKDDAEARLADIEEQWENVLEQHRDREEALREEISREAEIRSVTIREKEDLQEALDRLAESVGIDTNGYQLDADGAMSEAGSVASMATPKRQHISLIANNSSVMSPTAALASKVQKYGKSFTQIYADLARTEEALRREKLENRRLVGVLEQVMADLRDRAPALQAQREEKEQLEQHAEELSSALANACQERDISEREAKDKRLQAEAALRENALLNQQIADLARQVRDLSREVILRDDPSAVLNLEPDNARVGDVTNASLSSVTSSDTQTVITEQLVTFRSLTELVTQNSRLLRVVRQLGAEMEERETKYRSSFETQESEAVNEAKEVITQLQDDLRAERTRADSIRRERDMFRAMTAQSGRPSAAASTAAADTSAAQVTLTNQYSQLQAQFEALRTETANDMERLKEEAYRARTEANKSALAAAKEKAACESVQERLDNATHTFKMERKELRDLQSRYNALQESLARQEITAQSVGQQLVTAHATLERLRNEVSNLSAEKQLHKETTDRLMEEKRSSIQERANLSELVRNAQLMQADLERSTSDIRRRLESQVERLEEQNKDLAQRASKAEEGQRHITLRHDVETTELRSKLERATADLARVREELAVAKTSVQHLTTRSDELQRQVDAKDEKLAVYERRGGAGVVSGSGAVNGPGQGINAVMSDADQTQIELADVKGELRSAQVEAEQARAHVEQFRSIAAANEEALSELQSSYDQYKVSTEASMAQKDNELSSLRQRTEALISEISAAQNESSKDRQDYEKQLEMLKTEKKTLEDTLSEVTAVEDRARSSRESMQEEVRNQAQLTRDAHAKYEAELLAHAEDVRALTSVKEQLDGLRTQILDAQKAKETAEGNLASSTDSWTRQRELLEREKGELKQVIQELRGQNKALHDHLESLQQQAKEIRQAVAGGELQAGLGDVSISSQADNAEELHTVIRYLRREKEIIDLQVELRDQECARLRQSVEHTQRTLDEARLQLSQERERTANTSVSAKQHEDLMDKINQLSILRESNTTLRDETERAQRKVQTLEAKLESLTAEVVPMREELRIKTVELEACQNQLRLSQEDNKRWQGRTQSILQQYNRIDPDELKQLQERKEVLEKELAEQQALVAQQVSEIEEAKAETQAKQGQFDRLRQQSIDRIRSLNQTIKELKEKAEQLEATQGQAVAETDSSEQLSNLQADLDILRGEKEQLELQIGQLQQSNSELQAQLDSARSNAIGAGEADGSEDAAIRSAVEEAQKGWEAERSAMEEKQKVTERREQQHLQKAKEFNTNMRNAIKERDALLKEKEQWSTTGPMQEAGEEQTTTENTEVQRLQQRISELENQLKQANERIAALQEGGAAADVEELKKEHEAALREQEGRLSVQYLERQKQAVEIAVQKAISTDAQHRTGGEDVEAQVQQRLMQFESERQTQMQSAIEAKEQELRKTYEEQLKARYEAGKEEVALRNKLLLKTRDQKIERLTNELNTLKGIAPSSGVATTPLNPASSAFRPAVRPTAAPVAVTPRGGGGAGRGTGRGGGPAPIAVAGGPQKRKLSSDATAAVGQSTAAGVVMTDAVQAGGGGTLPKKPRQAGGPIAIRGSPRGGAAIRGGRGGGAAGGTNNGGTT
jgi:nucleoprotein TPR